MIYIFHLQIYAAVEPTVGHIVHHMSKGRNIPLLSGVQPDSQHIVFPISYLAADIHGKRRITTVMLSCLFSVYKHLALMGSALQRKKQHLSPPLFRNEKHLTVTAYHLVYMLVKIMKRQLPASMRKPYLLHFPVRIAKLCHLLVKLLRKSPSIVYINSFCHHFLHIMLFFVFCNGKKPLHLLLDIPQCLHIAALRLHGFS